MAALPFLVLPQMVKVADHLYEQVRTRRAGKAASAQKADPKRGKKRPLKETDPW